MAKKIYCNYCEETLSVLIKEDMAKHSQSITQLASEIKTSHEHRDVDIITGKWDEWNQKFVKTK